MDCSGQQQQGEVVVSRSEIQGPRGKDDGPWHWMLL